MIGYKDFFSSFSLDDALRRIDISENNIININEITHECYTYGIRVFYRL